MSSPTPSHITCFVETLIDDHLHYLDTDAERIQYLSDALENYSSFKKAVEEIYDDYVESSVKTTDVPSIMDAVRDHLLDYHSISWLYYEFQERLNDLKDGVPPPPPSEPKAAMTA